LESINILKFLQYIFQEILSYNNICVDLSIQELSRNQRYKTAGRGRKITALKVSDHPTHAPDFAPSPFHLFLHLKKHLPSQKFHKDEKVKIKVTTTWLCAQVVEFYFIGIQKLVTRLNICLDKGGD